MGKEYTRFKGYKGWDYTCILGRERTVLYEHISFRSSIIGCKQKIKTS
jgi:hypothetical protein